jgi:hypothetical protein
MTAHLITIAPQHDLNYSDDRGNPDLQKLVGIFGGYAKIPQWASAKWDADTAAYRSRMGMVTPGPSKSTAVVPVRLYPSSEECCQCYQRGVLGYHGETLARLGFTDPDLAGLAQPGGLILVLRAAQPGKTLCRREAAAMIATFAEIAPKLKKLLRMLSAEQPGEVVSAAYAIGRMLRTVGADWHDLAAQLLVPMRTHAGDRGNWHAMQDFCVKLGLLLRPRELEFITNIAHWRGDLTEKQYAWLSSIYARLRSARE